MGAACCPAIGKGGAREQASRLGASVALAPPSKHVSQRESLGRQAGPLGWWGLTPLGSLLARAVVLGLRSVRACYLGVEEGTEWRVSASMRQASERSSGLSSYYCGGA